MEKEWHERRDCDCECYPQSEDHVSGDCSCYCTWDYDQQEMEEEYFQGFLNSVIFYAEDIVDRHESPTSPEDRKYATPLYQVYEQICYYSAEDGGINVLDVSTEDYQKVKQGMMGSNGFVIGGEYELFYIKNWTSEDWEELGELIEMLETHTSGFLSHFEEILRLKTTLVNRLAKEISRKQKVTSKIDTSSLLKSLRTLVGVAQ
jgi:hypothetical protein